MKAKGCFFSVALAISLIEPLSCISQTNFGVSIGLDFAKIEGVQPNSTYFEILESGYGSRSYFGGLRIEQQVANSIFLSLQGSYTKKRMDAITSGIIPFKKLEFNEIRVAVTANWIPFSTFSIGGGLSQDFIPTVNKIRKDDSKEEISGGRREWGAVFQTSYFYRGFMLEANYFGGFKKIKTSRKSNIIKPISSFGLSLSYVIKVFDKRKDKKPRYRRI